MTSENSHVSQNAEKDSENIDQSENEKYQKWKLSFSTNQREEILIQITNINFKISPIIQCGTDSSNFEFLLPAEFQVIQII